MIQLRLHTSPHVLALAAFLVLSPMPLGCLLAIAQPATKSAIQFRDVTDQTGITFTHSDGSTGKHFIVEYVCAGLALFDFDNDMDVDIYFLNGANVENPGQLTERNALYRNDGNWRFTDVTDRSGTGDTFHALGVTVGDYDGDGNQDLYLNNYGPNRLLRNNGDGTFTDVTQQAGVENGHRVGAGTCFFDMDADGDLDLYVANYVKFSPDDSIQRTSKGFAIYASPLDYRPDPDTLYRNNGDGTFTDVSQTSGIAQHVGYGMGMVCADYDRDGDTDVLVGNDVGANFVFQNDGRGHFTEVGLLTGFAYDRAGSPQGTMGVDCGDYDNDGFLDIHVTSYQNELTSLYRNLGGALFEDATNVNGAGRGTHALVTWGNAFADFDHDGWKDVVIACGHLNDNVDKFDDRTSYHQPNQVYQNWGRGRFRNVTAQAGKALQQRLSSRGLGVDDLDNDGDLDVVILNARERPTLLRNVTSTNHHWLGVKLEGTLSHRDAIGARVDIVTSDMEQTAEVHRGRGYQGHFGSHLHFGLGPHDHVDQLRVTWLGGRTTVIKNIDTVDRVLRVKEPRP